ncbi:HAD-like protein [Teratosphaeria nubilosa]|uniref:HAD-like protein n=1 Tax=Teratosphaeria nubilosa TaxID=161662 RepID=A0A6G1KXU9_9PEZI|nr:HAD-like protein [Teratosphaeria nubilosa]
MSTMSHASPPPVRACLFDMDGLLIDSEDMYTICTNSVLHEFGKPDLPWHIKAKMQGRPGPAAGKVFQDWAQLPIGREQVLEKVKSWQKELFPTCKPLPGVEQLLQKLGQAAGRGNVDIALATSSHKDNYHLKTDHQKDLFDVFPQEQRILGDDPQIAQGRGKPAPDIYLLALSTINERRIREGKDEIKPAECLVFEDSVPGIESGRRAGMQVVWVPHPGLLNEMRGKEDQILAGQMGEYEEVEEKNQELGVVGADGSSTHSGAPGEVGDGWGRFLPSLEKFPYEDYGIKV